MKEAQSLVHVFPPLPPHLTIGFVLFLKSLKLYIYQLGPTQQSLLLF